MLTTAGGIIGRRTDFGVPIRPAPGAGGCRVPCRRSRPFARCFAAAHRRPPPPMNPDRFRRLRRALARRQPDLTVLMEGVHKAHNLSAVVRSCEAVGALEVHSVVVEGQADLHPAVSAGAARWVPLRRWASIDEAVAALRDADFRLIAAHPDPRAVDFRSLDYTRPTCFVVGSELRGLGERALELVDQTVTVPMMGVVSSLNVSVASAVLLYEAQRQRDEAGLYDASRLPPERFDRLLFEWAHPEIARRCREAGVDYPPLDDHGALLQRPVFAVPLEPDEG